MPIRTTQYQSQPTSRFRTIGTGGSRYRMRLFPPVGHLATAGALLLLAGVISHSRLHATDLDDDWTFLQGFVPAYNRVWISPPTVATADTVNAPVMGNGDMVVCIGGDQNALTYYIRKSDFWTDDGVGETQVREIPSGCLKISLAGADAGENLAKNKKATASSEYSPAQAASKAVDGSTGAKWCTADGEKTHWLMVDLGQACDISRWVVRHSGAGGEAVNANTRDFTLQKSDDGSTWTDVDSVTENTANVTDRNVRTFASRHARLTITKATSISDTHARIYAFELYRAPRAGVPADGISPAYRHEEGILEAEIKSTMPFSGAGLQAVSYTAATENTLVVELSSTSRKAVRIKAELNTDVLNRIAYPVAAGIDGEKVWLTRQTSNHPGARWISRVALAARVFGADQVVNTAPDRSRAVATFDLLPGKTVKIVTCMSGGKDADATTCLADAKSMVEKFSPAAIAALQTRHRDWWKNSWWLKSYARMYDDTLDKHYYRSMYQLGTMCRAGYVNSGLHGPWKAGDNLHNYSSYCSNDLGAAAYYLALISANRADTAKMWIQTCYDWMPEGRRRAKVTHGRQRGIYYPVHWAPWGAVYSNKDWGHKYCAPYDSLIGNWYYQYTGDVVHLKDRIYPFMKECADFYEDTFVKERDGKYHVHGVSGYESEDPSKSDSCMELLHAGILFTDIVKYSEVLGVDEDRRTKWGDIRDNLADFVTTTFGGETVYRADDRTPFNCSPNIIQTQIVWPGYACNRFSDPATRQIGYNTIKEATVPGGLNGWSQGNMCGQGLYIAALRIGGFDVADLISKFKRMIVGLNFMDFPFYISGLTVAHFNDQLCMQCYEEGIMVFPDYPSDKKAEFKRLRAPGAFLISGRFESGEPRNLKIYSENGNPCTVINPWPGKTLVVAEQGGTAVATKVDQVEFLSAGEKAAGRMKKDRYTFATTAGKTYRITLRHDPGSGKMREQETTHGGKLGSKP
ncbi:MAG: discoidin domain-containing protein [Chloroflexi bacterium]|nr:discoidin domain-containing protein [Chloroflexota bacterium]